MEKTNATQTRYPWRAVARTVFAAVTSLLALLPLAASNVDVAGAPGVAVVLTVAATVTRILAMPAVDSWLKTYLPFLSAEPK